MLRGRMLDNVCMLCLARRDKWPTLKPIVNKGDRWGHVEEPEELNLTMVYKGQEVDWDKRTGTVELHGMAYETYSTGWRRRTTETGSKMHRL